MSINAIGGMASSLSRVSASGSSSALSEETKRKLESLGVDTSKIKTESEGQQKLKEIQDAQAAQANKSDQGKHHQQDGSQIQSINEKLTSLASQVGVSISGNDKIPDILSTISNKISEMSVKAGGDTQKLQKISQYQNELNVIASEYASFVNQHQASQNQLSGGMDSLAAYNKIFHKL